MASVWALSAELAYDNLPLVHVGVVSDAGGQRFTAGEQSDLDVATSLPELNAFLTSIGYGAGSPAAAPSNLNDYTFRFHAVATGSILVLGGNKEHAGTTISNDLDATLAELNSDPGFVGFMQETSGALVTNNTGISFSQVIGENFISAASGAPFSTLVPSDQIVVSGSGSNDTTYTVQQVLLSGSQVRVTPSVTPESAGASVTITKA